MLRCIPQVYPFLEPSVALPEQEVLDDLDEALAPIEMEHVASARDPFDPPGPDQASRLLEAGLVTAGGRESCGRRITAQHEGRGLKPRKYAAPVPEIVHAAGPEHLRR